MKQCQECEKRRVVLKYDPRDPPLDTDRCLCNDCYKAAAEEIIVELQDRIDELKGTL